MIKSPEALRYGSRYTSKPPRGSPKTYEVGGHDSAAPAPARVQNLEGRIAALGPAKKLHDQKSRILATVEDAREDHGELLYITVAVTVGKLDDRTIVMVWTPRGEARRIVSMRKANEREQTRYAYRVG